VARRALAAAFLALAATSALAQEALGTLFMSAAERARLDAMRRGEAPNVTADSPAAAGEHALTGYVQRSDGRTTVWIDGRAVRVPARAAPRLEPQAVQDYDSDAPRVRIERRAPR
jgi:hypothetical protein